MLKCVIPFLLFLVLVYMVAGLCRTIFQSCTPAGVPGTGPHWSQVGQIHIPSLLLCHAAVVISPELLLCIPDFARLLDIPYGVSIVMNPDCCFLRPQPVSKQTSGSLQSKSITNKR